ncbi:MAG: hypothetical protein KDB11_21725 [Planctomycetales bacterium]|nr:hypothetical protein [Planctomycetales bacterium]
MTNKLFPNFKKSNRSRHARRRTLKLETLERREVFSGLGFGAVADPDDQISEAIEVGDLSVERTRSGVIDNGYDVDMYSFTARQGDTVEIEASPTAGSNLSARVRLFGEFLGRENQPLGNGIGSLRFQIAKSGTYYVGVSELGNEFYNQVTGSSDFNGPFTTSGSYRLSIKGQDGGNQPTPTPVPSDPNDGETEQEFAILRLVAVNENGDEISKIESGEDFYIQARAQDIRTNAEGVFSAYVDLEYDTSLVSPEEIRHGELFTSDASGDLYSLGELNEVGGFQSSATPPGDIEQLVFVARFNAGAIGTAQFSLNPADELPDHDILLYGKNEAVESSKVRFEGLQLEITDPNACQPHHNCDLAEDVNGDGFVSPIDALQVINDLNNAGARVLSGDGGAYVDVSADGSVSPLDALLVINYLNRRSNTASPDSSVSSAAGNQPITTLPLPTPTQPTPPTIPAPSDPPGRIPRNPSTPGSTGSDCAVSPVGVFLGVSCSSSDAGSTRQPRTGGGTAPSRVGQLLGLSSTTSAAYTSSVDRALDELLAPTV